MSDIGKGVPPACGHDFTWSHHRGVCPHLWGTDDPPRTHHLYFTREPVAQVFVCSPCAERADAGERVATALVCWRCASAATDGPSNLEARGEPELVERPVRIDADLRRVEVRNLPAPLVDLAFAERAGRWFGLCDDGTVVTLSEALDTVEAGVAVPVRPPPPDEHRRARKRLHVAPGGRFAAVVTDYGRYGAVVDLATGRTTMELDGDDHHEDTVPFAVAFATVDGSDLLVHRTASNRLDVSDPATGRLLTERPEDSTDEDGRVHGLDYFHGTLYASPDGVWLLDDGWAWYPVGIPRVWSLRDWLSANVWESDDGLSVMQLDGRDFWGEGMCWIDEHRLALEGLGEDEPPVPGARIFDIAPVASAEGVPWAKELPPFAGPSGTFFSDGVRLFSTGEDGLSIWDLSDGARLARLDSFRPRHHARSAATLVELSGDTLVVWTYGDS